MLEQWPPIALPMLTQGSMERMSYRSGSHLHQICDMIWDVDAWLGSWRRITPRTIMIVLVSVYRSGQYRPRIWPYGHNALLCITDQIGFKNNCSYALHYLNFLILNMRPVERPVQRYLAAFMKPASLTSSYQLIPGTVMSVISILLNIRNNAYPVDEYPAPEVPCTLSHQAVFY